MSSSFGESPEAQETQNVTRALALYLVQRVEAAEYEASVLDAVIGLRVSSFGHFKEGRPLRAMF
eukprot:399328-Hanusia_phi.AAC.2